MQNPTSYIVPILLIALAIFMRIARAIGFQKYNMFRPLARMSVCFIILGIVFVVAIKYHPESLPFDIAGTIAGAGLAYLAVRYAVFETRKDGIYYRTHIWIEIVILALFFVRLAYRFYIVYSSLGDLPPEQVASQLRYEKDPITGCIMTAFAMYYIYYFAYVIFRVNRINKPENSLK